MRSAIAGTVFCAVLIMLASTAMPSGDVPASMGTGNDRRGADLTGGNGKDFSVPGCGCPDLAYTELFESKGLSYVFTAEFGDAIQAVANGRSAYSPKEIPPEWPSAAAAWRSYIAAHPGGEAGTLQSASFPNSRALLDQDAFLSNDACTPALVYLASLEYRSRPGHQGVNPAFPRLVRTAIYELGSTVVAKNRMAPAYAARTTGIRNKIAEAERMGAQDCQPGELAGAKSALDHALRAASGARVGVPETDTSFAKAEKAADALLAKRVYAMQRGVKCLPE